MELHHLHVLRAIADSGSVSGAARLIHVTPSAVSQAVSSLQKEFAAQLTVKRGRTVVLSEAGTRLASAAIEVEIAMEQARNAVDDYLESPAEPVSVSAFHSAAAVFFPPLASMSLADGGRVTCRDEDVDQDSFPLLTMSNDIVIAHRMSNSAPWPTSRLQVVPLLQEPLDVAVRAFDPLAQQMEVAPTDVIHREWISSREGFPPDDMLKVVAAMAGRPPVIRHRVNDVASAAAVVRESPLLALMPRFMSQHYAGTGIVLRPVQGLHAVRHVDALIRPEQLARKRVRDTLDVLTTVASEFGAARGAEEGVGDDEVAR